MVVGRSSLLARELIGRAGGLDVVALSHAEATAPGACAGASCVINFAFAPQLETGPYDERLDVDARIAGIIGEGTHYIMISSRRVYAAQDQWNANESTPAAGMDAYGRNKAHIERELARRLGSRLTVLRPGNVLVYEPLAGRRRFGAYLQHQLLREGRIRLTVAAATRKDLVPADFFCRVLLEAALRRPAGTFNVGSGRATATGDAARWMLEGFGGGLPEVVEGGAADEFQLDVARVDRELGLRCDPGAVERSLRELGARIAKERSSRFA